MTLPETVIFDVDGKLIDANHRHALAWRDALSDLGHDIPLADLRA